MAEKNNEATATVAPAAEKITQMEAVKRSLEKLGKDAMPKEIRADIKERFKMEVKRDYVSKVKADLLGRRSASKKQAAKKPVASKQVVEKAMPGPTVQS